MMDDDTEMDGSMQQQKFQDGGRGCEQGGGGDGSHVHPEVWLDEETGDTVATLKGTDIVKGAYTNTHEILVYGKHLGAASRMHSRGC